MSIQQIAYLSLSSSASAKDATAGFGMGLTSPAAATRLGFASVPKLSG
jgi:hypothetical protein